MGAPNPIRVDVRIIAATHRSLEKLIREDKFREDLYYRLSVIPITLPPLRERREDIPLLANQFLVKYTQKFGRELSMDRTVLKVLDGYSWPGNIRELENLMERLAALVEGPTILLEDLPTFLTHQSTGIDDFVLNLPADGVALDKVEEFLIREALRRNEGNQTRAAKFLRITRNTLIYRIQKYGLAHHESSASAADSDPEPSESTNTKH